MIWQNTKKMWLMQWNKHGLARSKVSNNWKEVLNSQCLGFLLFGNQENSLKIVYLWLCFVDLWVTACHEGTKCWLSKASRSLREKETVQISLYGHSDHTASTIGIKRQISRQNEIFKYPGYEFSVKYQHYLVQIKSLIWNHIAALTKTKSLLFQISCMKVVIKAETRRENSNQKEPKKKKTVTVYFSDYIY